MAVRLLFPTYIFERDLLDPSLDSNRGVDQNYLDLLTDTMDGMRRKDPEGRRLSNAYTGWQSHDGCESNPAFQKIMNRIQTMFYDEIWPFHGLDRNKAQMQIGNSWANINDKLAWNKPHLHNGCWYSGVFYIKADGDEGHIEMIDTNPKVVSDFPNSPRTPTSKGYEPRSGKLILFPSGLMHMVEPNPTDKERYSISFNIEMKYTSSEGHSGNIDNYNPDEFVYNISPNGRLITD